MGNANVNIDQETCVGCGACLVAAPKAFALNSQGKSQPTKEASEEQEDVLLKAAQSCPVKAIEIIDQTGTVIYPKT
jgi:ferredoxin